MPSIERQGCTGRAAVMLFVVIAVALTGLGVAIYTLIERPTVNRLTPAGANYNPGSSDSVTQSAPRQSE